MLARRWHPVALSIEVTTAQPTAARLLDQALVLYRTSGGLTVAADLCAHRGTPLSLGCMREDNIACAYHGYRYEIQGHCTLVPAHPGGPIPGKLALRRFQAVELFGLIWVTLGTDGGQTLPVFPEHDDSSLQVVHVPPFDWAASAGRQVESFCDVATLRLCIRPFSLRPTPSCPAMRQAPPPQEFMLISPVVSATSVIPRQPSKHGAASTICTCRLPPTSKSTSFRRPTRVAECSLPGFSANHARVLRRCPQQIGRAHV